MRCVVLGGGGFIGSHLVQRLVDDGHEVLAVDRVASAMPLRQRAWKAAHGRYLCDLRTYENVAEAVQGAEWVFHLAADVGGVGYLDAHDYRPFFNNMRMSMNVLDACEAAGVQRLFYSSSSCVYPVGWQTERDSRPLREGYYEQGQPDLMYGREKLMTLRLCERAPFDARVGIFNTIFGPGLQLHGERMKYPAAITARAIQAAKTGEPLTIWGDGTQVRGYLHVADAVDKVMTIMTAPYEGPVNVTSIETASCTEVARMVLDELGTPDIPLEYVEGATGPAYRWVSNKKWEQVYGPDNQMSMREAYADFVRWVQGECQSQS